MVSTPVLMHEFAEPMPPMPIFVVANHTHKGEDYDQGKDETKPIDCIMIVY